MKTYPNKYYDKAIKVILSCETLDQMSVAKKIKDVAIDFIIRSCNSSVFRMAQIDTLHQTYNNHLNKLKTKREEEYKKYYHTPRKNVKGYY